MKATFVNTNDYYHHIIDAPDLPTRQQRYRALFLQPWKPMMDMLGPMFNADPAGDFAVARAWAWLLPEDLAEVPDALRVLEAADAWNVAADALAEGAARFAPYADRLPIDSVEGWLVLADPARADPIMRGYTGAVDWTHPRLVGQYDTPNEYNLPRLPGLVVHEMHHLVRLRLFPWDMRGTSVGDYIIHEGLAESFATALFGADKVGYFVSDFDAAEVETARRLIGEGVNRTGFDVIRAYIFGDYWAERLGLPKVGMPTYGGYAIGYHVVQAYLERTGDAIEAATFLPADTIIRESGFFA